MKKGTLAYAVAWGVIHSEFDILVVSEVDGVTLLNLLLFSSRPVLLNSKTFVMNGGAQLVMMEMKHCIADRCRFPVCCQTWHRPAAEAGSF